MFIVIIFLSVLTELNDIQNTKLAIEEYGLKHESVTINNRDRDFKVRFFSCTVQAISDRFNIIIDIIRS